MHDLQLGEKKKACDYVPCLESQNNETTDEYSHLAAPM
jgi:hypothetical protein